MATFDKTNISLEGITEPAARKVIRLLCNLVEEVYRDNNLLRTEVQNLRDENARLKGEQGKPNIRGKNQKAADGSTGSTDISSEAERKTPKDRKPKASKKDTHRITRTEVLSVDKATLPADAIFKGYETVTVQDIVISVETIEFQKEVYYSKSLQKRYTAKLPPGYRGAFGPHLKTLTTVLKTVGNMTEPKITELLTSLGVDIAASSVGRILTTKQESFHQEKADIFQAGLGSTSYQHIDDTAARVNGENWYAQVLCNPLYSAYFTGRRKDRLTILRILTTGDPDGSLRYLMNEEAIGLLGTMKLPDKLSAKLQAAIPDASVLTEEQLRVILEPSALGVKVGAQQQTRIREALAISYYHCQSSGQSPGQTNLPVIDILMQQCSPVQAADLEASPVLDP